MSSCCIQDKKEQAAVVLYYPPLLRVFENGDDKIQQNFSYDLSSTKITRPAFPHDRYTANKMKLA